MAKFAFRLDPVLDHRQRLEDEQQRAFSAALLVLTQAERVRADYIARRTEMRERLHTLQGKMDAIELRATYAHCDYIDRSIVAQQLAIDEAKITVAKERAELALKVQNKKVLEVLKERRRETFASEAHAIEIRESDEINSRQFQRAVTSGEKPSWISRSS